MIRNFEELNAQSCTCTEALKAKLDGSNGKRAVVLCGTLIYELVGPGVAKWTLQKAGEIEPGQ